MRNRLKKFKAMALTCMDPRFQPLVYEYLKKRKLTGKYSSFTIAGGAIGVTHKKFKRWHSAFIENLAASIKIHKINKLIVINHKDCGAAKIAEPKQSRVDEVKIHKNAFEKLKAVLKRKFPKIKFEFKLMSLSRKIQSLNTLLFLSFI
jgi:carbonic anhydrase